MSRAPTPQTSERLNLPNGYFLEPFVREGKHLGYDLCSADGTMVFGNDTMGLEQAQKFAAAMRPVEASPLPGDEEVAREIATLVAQNPLADHFTYTSDIPGKVSAILARHREQATADLRQKLTTIIRNECGELDDDDASCKGATLGKHGYNAIRDIVELLTAHLTKAESGEVMHSIKLGAEDMAAMEGILERPANPNPRLVELMAHPTSTAQDALSTDAALRLALSQVAELQEMVRAYEEAGQAVIDRWDSPTWKDLPNTGHTINALRKVIAAQRAKDGRA